MSSQQSAPEPENWWRRIFRRPGGQGRDTGWQRECTPPERIREYSHIPEYSQHSRNEMRQAPSRPFRQWLDAQPVLEPRLVEATGPKSRKLPDGHVQEVRPRLAESDSYPAWQAGNTDGIRQIPPRVPFRRSPLQQTETAELPDFLHVPDNPVTLPSYAERRYSRPLVPIEEVPTLKDIDIEAHLRALPPWRAPDPPTSAPDAWLNSPPAAPPDPAAEDIWPVGVALVEVWGEPDVQSGEEFDPDRTLKSPKKRDDTASMPILRPCPCGALLCEHKALEKK